MVLDLESNRIADVAQLDALSTSRQAVLFDVARMPHCLHEGLPRFNSHGPTILRSVR